MLKKLKVSIGIMAFLALMACPFQAFAQDYKIIKIKGEVLVRDNASASWEKAKSGANLRENFELMTKKNSECTFASGENVEKALTLKENSHIKIDPDAVGRLELPQGRVFALIEKKDPGSTFEIKTPIAVVGVRGTGLSVEAGEDTSVKCFEGTVYAKGLDEQGNAVSEKDVPEGSGVEAKPKGEITEPFEVSAKDKKEWGSFKGFVKDFIGKPIGKFFNAANGLTEGMVEGYVGGIKENPYNR